MTAKKKPVCDKDCLNCVFDDCINDEMDAGDYAAARELERDFIFPKTARQESNAAKKKAYYEENRESIAAKRKAYREENREAIAAYKKAYYKENREEWNAYMREYQRKKRLLKAENGGAVL